MSFELTPLQEASKEHILKVFQSESKSPPTRYLLADEVGLGKTKIAAGVICGMEENHRENKTPFVVYYICGNQRVTRQNTKKLLDDCDGIPTKADRFTMQLQHVDDYKKVFKMEANKHQSKVKKNIIILPLTPAITFTSLNSDFHEGEYDTLSKRYRKEGEVSLEEGKEALFEKFEKLRDRAFKEMLDLLPPNLIILDEFQNYNSLLEDYLKESPKYSRFPAMMCKAPCLLLSATPFQVKSQEVDKLEMLGTLSDDITSKETTEEEEHDGLLLSDTLKTTEQSFRGIYQFVVGKTFDNPNREELYNHFLCRTERSMFMEEEMTQEQLPTSAQGATHSYYNKELMEKTRKGTHYHQEKGKAGYQNWIKIAPSPLNFATRYSGLKKYGGADDSFLSKSPNTNVDETLNALKTGLEIAPDSHGGFAMLKERVLPEGVEHLLWIPPTLFSLPDEYKTEENPFWKHRNYTKTLVFCTYRMSTASTAYFMCQKQQKALEEFEGLVTPLKGSFSEDEKYYDEIWKNIPKQLSHHVGPLKEYVEQVVFKKNEGLVKNLTGIHNSLWGKYRYARMGGLKQVVEEYLTLIQKEEMFPLPTVDDPSEILLFRGQEKSGEYSSVEKLVFAERFTKEKEQLGGVTSHKGHEKNLQALFNAPFYPFMLSATATAQEGLDFHNYCHGMMHFSMPKSPVEFIQREGRMDRYRSHLVRKRLALLFPEIEDSMNTLFKRAEGYESGSPLFPNWHVSRKLIEKKNKTKEIPLFFRQVWAIANSKEGVYYEKLQQAVKEYATFLGSEIQEDRESFCPYLRK